MAVNNEIGTVQPLDAVAAVVRPAVARAPSLHTDAVQAVPWLDVRRVDGGGRPGGGQRPQVRRPQGGRGPGRPATGPASPRWSTAAGRSGSGVAAPTTWPASWPWPRPWRPPCGTATATVGRVAALRTGWSTGCWPRCPASSRPAVAGRRWPGICHLRFAGVESEALVVLLDEAGVAVSAGAACSSGAVEASHVLPPWAWAAPRPASGIRFSLGSTTTEADIDRALAVVPGAVAQLRD